MNESLFSEEYIEEKRIKREKLEIQKGVFYTGEWLDGQMDGYGVLQDQGFSVYEGFFKKGSAHGFGSIIYENGDHYVGDWYSGAMHGKGCYVTADGTEF